MAEKAQNKAVREAQESPVTRRTGREVTVVLPALKAPKFLQGFVDFIREQGVVGLAIGLILGFASQALVNSLVKNIFNPLIGLVTGGVALQNKTVCLDRTVTGACKTTLNYGQFLSDLISFLIVVAVVYLVFKELKLERLDKKKEEAAK